MQVTPPGWLDLLQPTGSRSYGAFEIAGESVVAEFDAHDLARVGERIKLDVDMSRVILINPQTDNVV